MHAGDRRLGALTGASAQAAGAALGGFWIDAAYPARNWSGRRPESVLKTCRW